MAASARGSSWPFSSAHENQCGARDSAGSILKIHTWQKRTEPPRGWSERPPSRALGAVSAQGTGSRPGCSPRSMLRRWPHSGHPRTANVWHWATPLRGRSGTGPTANSQCQDPHYLQPETRDTRVSDTPSSVPRPVSTPHCGRGLSSTGPTPAVPTQLPRDPRGDCHLTVLLTPETLSGTSLGSCLLLPSPGVSLITRARASPTGTSRVSCLPTSTRVLSKHWLSPHGSSLFCPQALIFMTGTNVPIL